MFRKPKIFAIAAGVQPDAGMTAPDADSFAHTVLGSGVSGPWPSMSSVNQVGLTAALRFMTSVVEFGSDVLTRLSGK